MLGRLARINRFFFVYKGNGRDALTLHKVTQNFIHRTSQKIVIFIKFSVM